MTQFMSSSDVRARCMQEENDSATVMQACMMEGSQSQIVPRACRLDSVSDILHAPGSDPLDMNGCAAFVVEP
jgi:L-serine deaminase